MVWYNQETGRIYTGPQKAPATMEANGWMWGDPPAPPDPAPAQEWVATPAFVDALSALIPAEKLAEVLGDPRMVKAGVVGLAQLPSDAVDLLDPRVAPWLAGFGLTLDDVRRAIRAAEELM